MHRGQRSKNIQWDQPEKSRKDRLPATIIEDGDQNPADQPLNNLGWTWPFLDSCMQDTLSEMTWQNAQAWRTRMSVTNIFTANKQSLTALTKKRIMLDVKISKSWYWSEARYHAFKRVATGGQEVEVHEGQRQQAFHYTKWKAQSFFGSRTF